MRKIVLWKWFKRIVFTGFAINAGLGVLFFGLVVYRVVSKEQRPQPEDKSKSVVATSLTKSEKISLADCKGFADFYPQFMQSDSLQRASVTFPLEYKSLDAEKIPEEVVEVSQIPQKDFTFPVFTLQIGECDSAHCAALQSCSDSSGIVKIHGRDNGEMTEYHFKKHKEWRLVSIQDWST